MVAASTKSLSGKSSAGGDSPRAPTLQQEIVQSAIGESAELLKNFQLGKSFDPRASTSEGGEDTSRLQVALLTARVENQRLHGELARRGELKGLCILIRHKVRRLELIERDGPEFGLCERERL